MKGMRDHLGKQPGGVRDCSQIVDRELGVRSQRQFLKRNGKFLSGENVNASFHSHQQWGTQPFSRLPRRHPIITLTLANLVSEKWSLKLCFSLITCHFEKSFLHLLVTCILSMKLSVHSICSIECSSFNRLIRELYTLQILTLSCGCSHFFQLFLHHNFSLTIYDKSLIIMWLNLQVIFHCVLSILLCHSTKYFTYFLLFILQLYIFTQNF